MARDRLAAIRVSSFNLLNITLRFIFLSGHTKASCHFLNRCVHRDHLYFLATSATTLIRRRRLERGGRLDVIIRMRSKTTNQVTKCLKCRTVLVPMMTCPHFTLKCVEKALSFLISRFEILCLFFLHLRSLRSKTACERSTRTCNKLAPSIRGHSATRTKLQRRRLQRSLKSSLRRRALLVRHSSDASNR
jgi:hypothetical protein